MQIDSGDGALCFGKEFGGLRLFVEDRAGKPPQKFDRRRFFPGRIFRRAAKEPAKIDSVIFDAAGANVGVPMQMHLEI